MRKIISSLFISLDGVIEAPHEWHFPYFNDEMGAAVEDAMSQTDTMLYGRTTFEEFASYWPQQGSEVELADVINNSRKVVVSNTLTSTDWKNSEIIPGDGAVEKIKALKAEPGEKHIGITGSATLVRWLLSEGLLDELRLLVHPLVVGEGKKTLFVGDTAQIPLKVAYSKTFETGVIAVTYVPA